MRYLLILTCCLIFNAQASDLAKEKRWAEQTVDAILDGEAETLITDDGVDFLSIYTEPDSESSKGIIVVHGIGVHPDWDQVVKPLRVEMAARGWHTLSLQMPILANDALSEEYVPLFPEVAPRMKVAQEFLHDKGVDQIVIVAHSMGSAMSAYYLSTTPNSIKAFVAVGMQSTQKDADINSANALKKISIPVLDLYGSEDLKGVLSTSEQKRQAAAHNPAYRQQVVPGAGHFFDGHNDELIEAVSGWLDKL